MRRIRDRRENETADNVRQAYDNYSRSKHKRENVARFDKDLDANIDKVLQSIVDGSFCPSGYHEKIIFEKKRRKLAKAPVIDHVTEAAIILPYEHDIYDCISYHSPAVRPGLGNHAFFRFLRNDLYRSSQRECYYNSAFDIHHYFPLMDHKILKEKLIRKIKPGKLLTFLYRIIDSYPYGAPLGIKVSQLFGNIYLSDFDRRCVKLFDIAKDSDKMAYWTSRYIDDYIATAKSADEYDVLSHGSVFLAERFRRFVNIGLRHYWRFVDNIIIMHEDKAFLHIATEIAIMHLTRDWHALINKDYNIRPTYMGIRICGYVFYHDRVLAGKELKKRLAERIKRLKKLGYTEDSIRIECSSLIGYMKHADTINLLKNIGMEKSLGKIIKNRHIKSPFKGMSPEQKEKFSTICCMKDYSGEWDKKILLEDYVIKESKIEKAEVVVTINDSKGIPQEIKKVVPGQTLAIRYKKILRTMDIDSDERYICEKKRDSDGHPTDTDAEFYSFTGSKILIDQALNDFSPEDLPCPTIIKQFENKKGISFFKFT